MPELKDITENLISCDITALLDNVKSALENGTPAHDILTHGLIKGMAVVGERMESGEMFIPEVLMAAHSMGAAVELLSPFLAEGDISSAGRVIIGTVKGDLHDIGKNLVILMMQSVGFEVIDLGVDVDSDAFLKAIDEYKPQVVGLSALLTTTMPMMRKTVEKIVASGKRDTLKIMVGGAPVDQSFADEIGADLYASDAGSASKLVKTLIH